MNDESKKYMEYIHDCVEWDGLSISEQDFEFAFCNCFGDDIMAKVHKHLRHIDQHIVSIISTQKIISELLPKLPTLEGVEK